jgi:DNA-binding XRE family transcriptional regulator
MEELTRRAARGESLFDPIDGDEGRLTLLHRLPGKKNQHMTRGEETLRQPDPDEALPPGPALAFYDRIRAARKAKKLSRRELAALAGISFETLSKLEMGRCDGCSYTLLWKIADALFIKTLDELVGRTPPGE